MLWALATTAFLMGLMGGAHCLAMCSVPCAALTGLGGTPDATHTIQWAPRRGIFQRVAQFHVGRLIGYGAAGAVVALAMEQLAWLGQSTSALRPLWTLMHVLILAWGGMMMVQAQQPLWVERAGRAAWAKVKPLVSRPGGLLTAGVAWALLPCGLLYTALLTAALSGSVLRGALCMVLFGVGSGVWLVLGPWTFGRIRAWIGVKGGAWGSRLAGGVLFSLGAWALWMEVVHGQPAPWCVP